MKRYIIVIILFFISCHTSFPQQTSVTEIQDVINSISKEKIIEYITKLQSYGTRFMLVDNRFEIAGWIKSQFENMGFTNVELDSFECATKIKLPPDGRNIDTVTTQVNVVATIPGTEKPDEIYIICGHYDSFTDNVSPFLQAPGADDNASGTAAVLESARAIMQTGFKPKATLKFIAFAAEELMFFGKSGSEHYAEAAAERGDNIKLVINNDMIGYKSAASTINDVSLGHNNYSEIGTIIAYAGSYAHIQIDSHGYAGADLQAFFDNGYEGIYFEEGTFNEVNYHKTTDVIQNMNISFCWEVIKASCASLLSIQQILTEKQEGHLPIEYCLYQNYPNPFNPVTIIKYQIAEPAHVIMKVFNLLGQEVAEPVNSYHSSGHYQIEFDGRRLSSGTYIYSLQVDGKCENRKMILLK